MTCPTCGWEMLTDLKTSTSVCLACPGVVTDESLADGPAPVILTDDGDLTSACLGQEIAQHQENLRRIETAVRASTYSNPDDDPAVVAVLDSIAAQYK
jgi:transcription initiation factor TFIIIB Brf1 subunit/transcription initiation factor TFIIB